MIMEKEPMMSKSNKDISLAIVSIFVGILVISSCAGSGGRFMSSSQPSFNAFPYSGSPSFSVDYLSEWNQQKLDPGEVLHVQALRFPKMTVSVGDVPAEGFDLEKGAEMQVNSLRSDIFDAEQFRIHSKNIRSLANGEKILEAEIHWKYNFLRMESMQMLAIKDGKIVNLLITKANSGGYEADSHPSTAVMKQMIGSFEFKQPDKELALATAETADSGTVKISVSDKPAANEKKEHIDVFANTKSFSRDLKVEEATIRLREAAKEKNTIGELFLSDMMEDTENLEIYEPESVTDMPDTGVVLTNNTDRKIKVSLTGNISKYLALLPGETSSVSLTPGAYKYWIGADYDSTPPDSVKVENFLTGERKILDKIRYNFNIGIRVKLGKKP